MVDVIDFSRDEFGLAFVVAVVVVVVVVVVLATPVIIADAARMEEFTD